MKQKKIDREFLITDSSVNMYGFRLMTDGYLLDEVKKNPIGYRMHLRDEGVVVRWEDFRIDGDKVYAKPVVNLSNPKGQQVADEIENGFLNGASVGQIVVLEWTDDQAMKLPDQTGITVTKWYNKETSVVDLPGNTNALADLIDADGNALTLEDLISKTKISMEKIFLTPEQLQKLNLKADAKAPELDTILNDLVAKAAKVEDLQAKLDTAIEAKTTAETQLADLKKQNSEKEVQDLLAAAKTDRKITQDGANKLKEQFKGNPEGLKAVLDVMQPVPAVVKNLKAEGGKEVADLTWSELDAKGLLEDLKANDPNTFFDKFKQEFGKAHNEDKR